MKYLLIILSSLYIISGCSKNSNEPETTIKGKRLKQLVEEALWGSVDANSELSDLVNPKMPSPDKSNKLAVDSSKIISGDKLYSVLIEYPDPRYNVLAVYDDSLNLLLQDNSLNGNIVVKWENLSGKLYLVASENFLSKDILKLSRISLYSTENKNVDLVFRTFTKLEKADKIYKQYVENVTSIAIVTRITSNADFVLNNTSDTFKFSSFSNKYSSSDDNFNQFVLSEVKNANWPLEKAELTPDTIVQQTIIPEAVQQSPSEFLTDVHGFQITLNKNWSQPIRIGVTDNLISKLEGIRYINEKLGAQFTVIELPTGSNASQFVKYKFTHVSQGNYRVRSTDLLNSGKNVIQFFEHSCSNKVYILILQAPKYTYDKYKNSYNEISNSFFIEC